MRNSLAAAFCLGLMTACTVGPRYEEPEMPVPANFDQAAAEATAQPAGSKLWAGFGSPELDALITRALAANTTIATGRSTPCRDAGALRVVDFLLFSDGRDRRGP